MWTQKYIYFVTSYNYYLGNIFGMDRPLNLLDSYKLDDDWWPRIERLLHKYQGMDQCIWIYDKHGL